MNTALVGFWLRRFALVFAGCGVLLVALAWIEHGARQADYASLLGWSALAAALTASINSYWAWKHGCRIRR